MHLGQPTPDMSIQFPLKEANISSIIAFLFGADACWETVQSGDPTFAEQPRAKAEPWAASYFHPAVP